jgi:hypothetical protein
MDVHRNTTSLIIATTDDVHSQIGRLLEKLRGREVSSLVGRGKRVPTLRIVEPAKSPKKGSDEDPFAEESDDEDPFGGGSSGDDDPFKDSNNDPFDNAPPNDARVFESVPLVVHNNERRLVAASNPIVRTTYLGKVVAPIWNYQPVVAAIAAPAVARDQKVQAEPKRKKTRGKKKPASDEKVEANEGYTRRVYFVAPSGNRWGQSFGGGIIGSTVPVVGQRTPTVEEPKKNAVTLNQFGGGGGGGFGGGGGSNQQAIMQYSDPDVSTDDLAEILQELVAPKSWETPEAYIRALPGRLVIRQDVEHHRAVIDFLSDLGVYRGLSAHSSTKDGSSGGFGGQFGGGQSFGGGEQGGFFAVPNKAESTK